MGIEEKKSIIHRKAKGGRDEFNARVMSPVKALRLGLARVADKMLGLALTVTTVEHLKLPHKDVQAEMGDDGMLLLLDGAAGARGAVKVDAQLLTALIEVQTTGAVRRAEAAARPVTRTDAAIVQPLLDATLQRYDAQMSEAFEDHVPLNFRFGDLIEEARLLSLALEAPEYDLYRMTLDLAEGAKTGVLKLLLPHRKVAPVADKPDALKTGPSVSLEKNALEAQVAMDAVLARVRLPLKEICNLSPGAVVPLDAECLSKAQLVAKGGHVVAKVRMGQMNGMRAVRFIAPALTENDPRAEKSEDRKPGSKADRRPAPYAAQEDVVLEGVANPLPEPSVPDLPQKNAAPDLSEAGDKGILSASATGPSVDVPVAESEQAGTDTGGELSAADLMLAATAMQNQGEDA